MKVVTESGFSEDIRELLRSGEAVLVTREDRPMGLYLPWDSERLPAELRRQIFADLSDRIRAALESTGVTEEEVLADFAAERTARRIGSRR